MYRKILLPLDGTPLADALAEKAIRFARDERASLFALTIVRSDRQNAPEGAADVAAIERRLVRLQHHADQSGVWLAQAVVMADDPAEAILEAAQREQCDLIYMGSHRRSGLSRLFRPSVTARVVKRSRVAVTVQDPTHEEVLLVANGMPLPVSSVGKTEPPQNGHGPSGHQEARTPIPLPDPDAEATNAPTPTGASLGSHP